MSEKDKAAEYLFKNPYPEQYYGKSQVDFFYYFRVNIPPDKLWPLISNTSEINRMLGLERMTFEEKNGKLTGKGKLAYFYHEWEELPWEWDSSREMKSARIYSRGIVEYFRAHYFFSAADDNSTELTIYLGWVPRNIAGFIALKFAKRVYGKKYRKVIDELQSKHESSQLFNISKGLEKYAISDKTEAYRDNEELLKPVRGYLAEQGIEESVIHRLINYVMTSADDMLYRIRPKILVEKLDIELGSLLSVLLHSCRCGLLNISWDVICPHCRGVRENYRHLWKIENRASCEICDIEFSTGGINIIEVTFSVNPAIRKVEKILYCSAEPAKKPHILLQKNIPKGGTLTFIIPEMEKRLRFRTKGKKIYGILDVEKSSTVKNLYWDDLGSGLSLKCAPGSTVFINNTDRDIEHYTVEITEDDQCALRPADLFNFHEFREIFSDETLAYGISIDIGVQNILFIDIVGSTEYYKNFGDTEAFKTVRKYFAKVNEIAVRHHGVIVKTIGDAVMLSFPRPLDALKCAIKLLSAFDGSDNEIPVKTRVSINRGTCLAVNLDTLIDYFGQTVNIASKLQGFTDAGEISLTENFTGEPSVSSYLKEKNYSFKNVNTAEIRGAGEIRFNKIRIKKLPK